MIQIPTFGGFQVPALPGVIQVQSSGGFQVHGSGIEYDAFPLPAVTRCQQSASFPAA